MGLVEELKELVALKSAGALSDSEFLDAKAAVLAASKTAAAPSPVAAPKPVPIAEPSQPPRAEPAAAPKSEPAPVATPAKASKESKAARKAARKAAKQAAPADGSQCAVQGEGDAAVRPTKRAKREATPAPAPSVKPRAGAKTPKYRASTVQALKSWKVGDMIAGTSTGAVFGGNAGSGTFRTGFSGVGVSCLQVGEDWNPDILRSTDRGEIWSANSPDLCRKADGMQIGYTLPLLTRASKEKSKGEWTFRGWYELVSVQQDEAKIRDMFANREVPKSFRKMLASGHKVTLEPEDKSLKFVIGRVCALRRTSSPFE
jgi:hypothetical protein